MNQLEAIEAAKEWDWAKWVAMDADGSWWAFKDKPIYEEGRWETFSSYVTRLHQPKIGVDPLKSLAEVTP